MEMKAKKSGRFYVLTAAFAWLALVGLFCIGLFCVCRGLMAEYMEYRQVRQASDNAVRYIQNKYGITAEIIKVHERYTPDDGKRRIQMSYNDKSFVVCAEDMCDSAFGRDGYQYDEIAAAFTERISSELQGGICVWSQAVNTESFDERGVYYGSLMFDTYFDGTNLDEIMNENFSGDLTMLLYDTDLSEHSELIKWLCDHRFDLELVCLDTKEHMEEFSEFLPSNVNYYGISPVYYKYYVPHITDYLKAKDGVITQSGVNIRLNAADEFSYCRFEDNEEKAFPKTPENDDLSMEISEYDVLGEVYEYRVDKDIIKAPISQEYCFNNKEGSTWIYYPLDKLEGHKLEDIALVYTHISGVTNDIIRPKKCGDHAVFECLHSDMVLFCRLVEYPEK